MTVRNLNGSVDQTSGGSWLSYWEKASGQNAFMCFATGCIKRPSAGGRVQKDSATEKGWYVIPLCGDCNNARGQDLDIWDAATLVPVAGMAVAGMALPASANRAPRYARSMAAV